MRVMSWLIAMSVMISAVQAGSETKDELLSLLDEIDAAVADVEASFNTETPAVPGPNQPAEITTLEIETAVPTDPNLPEMPAEPNLTGPAVVEPDGVPESEDTSVVAKSRQLRRDFFRVQLEPVKTMTSEEQEKKLDALIAKINSLEPAKKLVVVAEEAESAAVEEPVHIDPPTQEAAVQDIDQVEPESGAESEPQAVSLLTRLKETEQVIDPMQLADILYRQGHTAAAYTYYRQTSEQLSPKDAETLQWVLFQMANCLRDSDPGKALEMYSDLLSRFPNSRWSAAAQSRRTTLEWIMKESIQQFVAGDL